MNLNQQIEHWLQAAQKNFHSVERPFVTLSYAQSVDGSIALQNNAPLPLSGQESLCLTHQLRSLHDGILVGIGTVLSDDPQLTVRHWAGHNPQPIVLDSQLRIPAKARLCCLPDKRCWVLTTIDNRNQSIEGLEITSLQSDAEGRVCLQNALQLLRQKGIHSLMVEGGASVISAFLASGFVDAVVITLTPRFVGGYKAVNDEEKNRLKMPKIKPFFSAPLGDDLILWGKMHYEECLA